MTVEIYVGYVDGEIVIYNQNDYTKMLGEKARDYYEDDFYLDEWLEENHSEFTDRDELPLYIMLNYHRQCVNWAKEEYDYLEKKELEI